MTSGEGPDTTPPAHPACAVDTAKRALRRDVLARRRARPAGDPAADTARLGAVLLATPELARLGAADAVAGYLPLAGEPSPVEVLAVLSTRGVAVLLPVLLPDGDLDWALAGRRGSAPADWSLVPHRAGTTRPDGPTRGPGAVVDVAVVLLPGVAGDAAGRRLGRGGGSYDRALARLDGRAGEGRVAGGPWTCLLLWPGEVVEQVPTAGHDRRVDALATAAGVVRVRPADELPER